VEDRWLTPGEVAEHLGVKKGTVYRWVREMGLPAHRLGKFLRFRKSEVDEWVAGQGVETGKPGRKEDILRLLSERRDEIKKRFGVVRIGLFGSLARGEERAGSDVDILVEFEEPTFDAYVELKFYLEELFGREVDLVIESDVKPALREKIMGEVAFAEGF